MKIYYDRGNPNALKILIAAGEVKQGLDSQLLKPGGG